MKKTIAVLLLLVLAVSMCACGPKTETIYVQTQSLRTIAGREIRSEYTYASDGSPLEVKTYLNGVLYQTASTRTSGGIDYLTVVDDEGNSSTQSTWTTYDDRGNVTKIEQAVGYPAIIKPYNLGSSVGIHKCRDRASLLEGLEDAFLYSQAVLAERAVQNLREINCAVLGDDDEARASVCEEPLNATDILTYADKYQSGGKTGKTGAKSGGGSKGMQSLARVVPADLSPEMTEKVQQLAIDAFRAIGACGCSRIDFLLDNQTGELFANEINTIPGSLAFYLWEKSGLTFTQLMDEMIRLALKRQRQQSLLHRSFETNLLQHAQIGGAKAGKKV